MFFPFCRLSLQSGGHFFCCTEGFKFEVIPFANSSCYFLSPWSPVQVTAAYAYIFKCFPAAVSGLILRSLIHFEVIFDKFFFF
jgi:hypothetical protein